MLTQHDLHGRIRRLDQLVEGLNAELVRVAMEHDSLTREEKNAYLEAVADMAGAAQVAVNALRPALGRLVRRD